MIKNERQYRITRTRADEIRNTIGELQRAPLPDGLQPEMRELQLDALRGTLGDLDAELAEYDALHNATLIEATGIEQLPMALIRARIACGLTQRQLAERIGLQEQAIQRYEATDYSAVSFSRLVEIAEALGLTVHYDVRLAPAG
jgi:HTH-type transcriptional regulator / antitoxin HipB